MRYLVLLLPLFVLGCASLFTSSPTAAMAERKASVIFVGMPLTEAMGRVEAQKAHAGMLALLLTKAADRKGIELHQYVLPNGRFLLLNSAPRKTGRIVSLISISTYNPKSSECLMDPEHQKFMESFRERNEFDLEEPMPVEPADALRSFSDDALNQRVGASLATPLGAGRLRVGVRRPMGVASGAPTNGAI